jgi:molybdate transport system ATP-binding protein
MRILHIQTTLQRDSFALRLHLPIPGQGITAVLGTSGSGKTSLLRVVAGLEPTAQGRITLGDSPSHTVWQDSGQGVFVPTHQRAIGYVFQEPSLFEHLTVEGNVRFGYDRTPELQRHTGWPQVLELLEVLGIASLLHRRSATLSGGERQRVAIARALAASPQLLLMDEPLAALDTQRKAELLAYLEKLQKHLRIPVLYVTHSIEEAARLSDYLVLLDQGQVQGHGTTQQMLTRLDMPLAHHELASAVLMTTVGNPSAADAADGLIPLQFAGGVVWAPGQPGSAGQAVRVRISARDVSLSLKRHADTSFLNILPARVAALQPTQAGQIVVSLELEGSTLLARLSQRSAHALRLEPGLPVFAQIKGVALLV